MVIALGIDIGSTAVKASVVRLSDTLDELAVTSIPSTDLDGAGLVAAALRSAGEALKRAAPSQAQVIGVASMAETGALTDAAGAPRGALIRWDRLAGAVRRHVLPASMDARTLHEATGVPLTPKLPLLTWATLAKADTSLRWAFTADLIVAALTGRRVTDHTLAGRSGAFPLPATLAALPSEWDAGILAEAGIPAGFPPPVLAPGEAAGTVTAAAVAAFDGLIDRSSSVYVAGHDHAVAAWMAGARSPGRHVRSIGTSEAVVSVAAGTIERERAWLDGISIVRTVDGAREAALAGSPAAGSLIRDWRARVVSDGGDADELLHRVIAERGPAEAIALPYPRGRQCPDPDPAATLRFSGVGPGDRAGELHALLRGIAAHGGWMLEATTALSGEASLPVLVGAPYRRNERLAALSAAVAGAPLAVVDLAAPVADGAAMLAAVRDGLAGEVSVATRPVPSDELTDPGFVARFRLALSEAVPAPASMTDPARASRAVPPR